MSQSDAVSESSRTANSEHNLPFKPSSLQMPNKSHKGSVQYEINTPIENQSPTLRGSVAAMSPTIRDPYLNARDVFNEHEVEEGEEEGEDDHRGDVESEGEEDEDDVKTRERMAPIRKVLRHANLEELEPLLLKSQLTIDKLHDMDVG